MQYRTEIDGLRALAILPVILFHAGFELFSGGFIGVDIFFVISGYLITTILIEDIEHKRFSILIFYERRARRILPALTLVTFISIIAAWIFLSNASLNKFGNGIIGVSLFSSNIVFWLTQGYFTESAELNPILHTWSLAVEEQYYVLFPIFLLLAWRFGKKKVFWIIFLLAVISLTLSEWAWRKGGTYTSANFFLAPTRAWELFAGSITAFIVNKRGVKFNNFLATIGLFLIIISIFLYNKSTPSPSIYTLATILGVILLILYGEKSTIPSQLLSSNIFVWIGLISYSAYLWHQPLFAFYRTYRGTLDLSSTESLSLVITTLVLAVLTWKFIETPFRNKNLFNIRKTFTLTIFILFSIATLGYLSKIASSDFEKVLAGTLAKNDFIYFENMDERKFVAARLQGELHKVDHIFVGSSRIMQISSKMVGNKILNLSVSGASIEDDVAFLLEATTKLNPKHVYIGADPWLINTNDRQDRYKSVNDLYEYWLKSIYNKELKINTPTFYNVKNNSHINSLNSLVKSIRENLNLNSTTSVARNGKIEAKAKKAYDGLHIYNEEYVNTPPQHISDDFTSLLDYAMKDFSYDFKSEEILVKLIEYLHKKDIKTTLVLSPYHPELFARMQVEKPLFLELEKKFREISRSTNVQIIGSYNPMVVGCSAHEFYDGMHPKSECMQKVISQLLLSKN